MPSGAENIVAGICVWRYTVNGFTGTSDMQNGAVPGVYVFVKQCMRGMYGRRFFVFD